MIITVNVFDDAAGVVLNPGGKQLTVFERMAPETVIGSGLTRAKQQQRAILSDNAAKAVERYLLDNPQWFEPQALAAPMQRPAAAGVEYRASGVRIAAPRKPGRFGPLDRKGAGRWVRQSLNGTNRR